MPFGECPVRTRKVLHDEIRVDEIERPLVEGQEHVEICVDELVDVGICAAGIRVDVDPYQASDAIAILAEPRRSPAAGVEDDGPGLQRGVEQPLLSARVVGLHSATLDGRAS